MKAFRASAAGGSCVTADTPRQAALALFDKHPEKRKCDVIEGEADEHFFTVAYGRASEGKWPKSWKNVTRKTISDLPDTKEQP